MMGPLEYMVIGFDGDRISPEIVREIDAVRNDGTVRMLDLMIIAKDGDGGVSTRQMSDLSEADAQALGMVDDDPADGQTNYGWLSEDVMASSASRRRLRPRWRRCSAAGRSAAGHPPRMRCFSVANSASVSLPRSCRSASTWS